MLSFEIEHHPETASTNTLLLGYARSGRPEGLVVTADYQTEGRGKPGRIWESPAGKNLLFSVLLRPPIGIHQAPILTQIACRSIAAALAETCGLACEFKRPNDVMVRGRKICGILTEAQSSPAGLEAVVVGAGVNVNSGPDEIPPTATSVLIETGKKIDRRLLLDAILQQLKQETQGLYAPLS